MDEADTWAQVLDLSSDETAFLNPQSFAFFGLISFLRDRGFRLKDNTKDNPDDLKQGLLKYFPQDRYPTNTRRAVEFIG